MEIIGPLQVKGKYPSFEKGDKITYGYMGKINRNHPVMILAVPYFTANEPGRPAVFVAYIPYLKINGC